MKKSFVSLVAAVCVCPVSLSARIEFVGVQSGDDFGRFGGAGSYILAPGADVAGVPLGAGGMTEHGTVTRKPAFLADHPKIANAAKWVNYAGYAGLVPPGGDRKLRIGGVSLATETKGVVEGLETRGADVLSFKLSSDAGFRMGVLIDAFDGRGAYCPDFVGIRKGDGEVVYSRDVLKRDGLPDLVLFDVVGSAGDDFTVSLHRAAAAEGLPLTGLSSLSFDLKSDGKLPGVESNSAAVGEFQRAGEYFKDYYVFKEDDTFHLFYNVGNAGPVQDWRTSGNEKAFGHATSKDLRNWKHHPRVLEVVPGTWEGEVVSAPSILKHKGLYYMIYTGFDNRWTGMQTVGLATSKDLFNWKRHPGNPVYRAPEWALTNPNGWENCRDAHIIRYKDEFLLYTMVLTKKQEGAISLASSKNAVEWKDLGPAVIAFKEPESPRVFDHNGVFYMFASSGHGRVLLKTRDPKSNKWEEVPFNWPANSKDAATDHFLGIWSGWEVVEHQGETVFSAFYWKPHGGFIRFWKVEWDGETPVIVYEKK